MNTRNDRDLDDLLGENAGKVGANYRKLGKPEPPRRLDRNVLAEASRAVHGRPRASRWLLGAGTAAGVLLAGGIAWRVNHDMLQQRESAPMSSPAVEAAPEGIIRVEPREKSAESASRSDNGATTVDQPGAATVEPADAAMSDSNAPVERKAARAKQKLDNAFAPDPAIKKAVPKPAQEMVERREELRELAAPMPPPAPASPAAEAPMQMPMRDESKAAQRTRRNVETEGSAASEPMQKAEDAGQTGADSSNISTSDDTRRERASSFGDAAVTEEFDRIRALLRAGRRDAALKALRELRREHPDLTLPADLRTLDG